jgi:hypothetical protein
LDNSVVRGVEIVALLKISTAFVLISLNPHMNNRTKIIVIIRMRWPIDNHRAQQATAHPRIEHYNANDTRRFRRYLP